MLMGESSPVSASGDVKSNPVPSPPCATRCFKLISGKVRVVDAERFLESTV
jgi:hypothetical protein